MAPTLMHSQSYLEKNHDEAEPTVRVGSLAHELLERRGKGHGRTVQDCVRKDWIPATWKERGEQAAEERTDGLDRS
jgi:hypothetical protein